MESLPLDARYAVSAAIGIEIGSGGQHILLQPVAWGNGEELALLPSAVPQVIGNFVFVQ